MADADARLAEPGDLLGIEMNAVREPGAARHPAGFLEEIDRPQAIHLETEALLVVGLAEMGVQLAVVALGQAARSRPSDRLVTENGEHGASATRICAPGFGSWNSFSTRSLSARIVSSSCTTLSGGRPPSFCDRFIDPRVTVMRMPSATRLLDLDVDRVLKARRIEIVMIGGGRAARQHEFGQREARREPRAGAA